MIAHRVSRRTAIVAAAGWVAAPGWAEADGWRCEAPGDAVEPREITPLTTGRDRVFVLYRELARFLRDPAPDRVAALRRVLGSRQAERAHAAYGDGLEEYLLEQAAGLDPGDARWAKLADAAAVPAQVRTGLARGRALLGADESPAVFLIFSRRFDGRTDGRRIFFGVDRFGVERLRDQVALLTVHEYNHVVRARATSFATLIGGVIAEGLATACSRLSEPDRPLRDHLLFSPAQFAWYTPERLTRLWADLSTDPFSTDPERRRIYLDGGQPGPCDAPPRSGYYLGYLLIHRLLARGASIATLTRTSAAEIWSWSKDAEL